MENVAERDRADIRQGLDRMIADVKARAVPREMLQGRPSPSPTSVPSRAVTPAHRHAAPGGHHRGGQAVREGGVRSREARPVRALPLSMTFDHRACTGGEAARFLKALVQALESAEV